MNRGQVIDNRKAKSRLVLVFAIPFGLALLIYNLTAASGLSWQHGGEDGGDLAVATVLIGVPHPTGYPLYLLTGRFFLLFLPNNDPARVLNLTGALCGALAVGITALTVFKLNHDGQSKTDGQIDLAAGGGIVAGLSLAFAPLVWSQALIVEVYSFNLALNALLLLALMYWWEASNKFQKAFKRLAMVALLAGLAVSHHRTSLFTVVGVVAFVLIAHFCRTRPKTNGAVGLKLVVPLGLFSLGCLLPYLYLFWRGGQEPASNWSDVNLAGFWEYFSGNEYHDLLFVAPLSQSIGRISTSANLLLQQFGPIGLALGWLGLVVSWWNCRPLFWLSLIGMLLHLGFALVYAADNSQVYLLPAFWLWTVLIGYGFTWIGTSLAGKLQGKVTRWFYPALIILVGPGLILLANYARLDLSSDRGAEEWAKATLQQTPTNAILLSDTDTTTFALWYGQYVRHYRPEVIVIERRLLDKPWYRRNLTRLYPKLNLPGNTSPDLLASLNSSRVVLKVSEP